MKQEIRKSLHVPRGVELQNKAALSVAEQEPNLEKETNFDDNRKRTVAAKIHHLGWWK